MRDFIGSRYPFVRQVDQHLNTENVLATIQNNVEKCETEAKLGVKNADSLSNRLERIQGVLSGVITDSTDNDIYRDVEFKYSRRELKSTIKVLCEKCHNRIFHCMLQDHELVCIGEQNDINWNVGNNHNEPIGYFDKPIDDSIVNFQLADDTIVKSKPRPPRNLSVSEIGKDYFTIKWDDPVWNGGDSIDELEISYQVLNEENEESVDNNTISSMFSARWSVPSQLKSNFFTVLGLYASTVYSDIKIRCKNSLGWSEYSEEIKSVMTRAPVPPSSPENFECIDVNDNSVTLKWSPPQYLGGVNKLQMYVLRYSQTCPRDELEMKGNEILESTFLIEKIVQIPGDVSTWTLSGIPGNTVLTNFEIEAISNGDLKSLPVKLNSESVTTLPSTRENYLRNEIMRVEKFQGDYIDVIAKDDLVQRDTKCIYLSKLRKELESITQHHSDENIKPLTFPDSNHNEESMNENHRSKIASTGISLESRNRLKNFDSRINILQNRIADNEKSLDIKLHEISFLNFQISKEQDRIPVLRKESERICMIKNETVTSSVLNGYNQTYDKRLLSNMIAEELNNLLNFIASCKRNILSGNEMASKLRHEIQRDTMNLKERMVAKEIFQKKMQLLDNNNDSFWSTSNSVRQVISIWLCYVTERKKVRSLLQKLFCKKHRIVMNRAFHSWKMSHANDNEEQLRTQKHDEILSKGSVLLQNSKTRLESHAASITHFMNQLHEKSTLTMSSKSDCEPLSLKHYTAYIPKHLTQMITKGDICFQVEKYEDALKYYELAISNFEMEYASYKNINVSTSLRCYCLVCLKLSQTYIHLKRFENSILHLEQILSMVRRSSCLVIFLPFTYYYLGESYMNIEDYSSAEENFLSALTHRKEGYFAQLESLLQKNLSSCQQLIKGDLSTNISAREVNDDDSTYKNIKQAVTICESLQQRLGYITAVSGSILHLEPSSVQFTLLNKKRNKTDAALKQKTNEMKNLIADVKVMEKDIVEIKQEIHDSRNSAKKEKVSLLLHGNAQRVDTDALVHQLNSQLEDKEYKLPNMNDLKARISTDIKNFTEELKIIDEMISVEKGPLIQKILKSKVIRCMSFNTTNTAESDVTGSNTQSIPYIAFSIDKEVYICNMKNGIVDSILLGDRHNEHFGKIKGHTSIITCLRFVRSNVYTGSMDKTVIRWSLYKNEPIYICEGHNGTVTCLDVNDEYIVSGSVDMAIIVWNLKSGDKLQCLRGHSGAIKSVHFGFTWCVSGDTEGEMFIWDQKFNCISRLKSSSRVSLSTIKCGNLEIITGNKSGIISIWWIETSSLLKECQAHEGPVLDLEFDSSKIISCGTDYSIKIIDITTCEILQTIRDHTDHVVTIAFDSNALVSLSRDRTFRIWYWGRQGTGDTVHTCSYGESLHQISRKYGVPVLEIMKLNDMKHIKELFQGQSLIIKKHDKGRALGTNVHKTVPRIGNKNKFTSSASLSFRLTSCTTSENYDT